MISFEDIDNIFLVFESLVNTESKMVFVFTNILSNQLTGQIANRGLILRMYFRTLTKNLRDQTSVVFRNIDVKAELRLLNFQDIAHITVVESGFENIDQLDVFSENDYTKCHKTLDTETRKSYPCSKESMFLSTDYATSTR